MPALRSTHLIVPAVPAPLVRTVSRWHVVTDSPGNKGRTYQATSFYTD